MPTKAELEKQNKELEKKAKKLEERLKNVKKSTRKRYEERKREMQDILNKEEKEKVFIPLGEEEPEGAIHPVTINGCRYEVPKGKQVSVPKSVADMIAYRFTPKKANDRLSNNDKEAIKNLN
jgi:diphthamide synthase subunit DPH2